MKPMRIVIFAKAALPSLAKTRLIPVLGRHGAADLAQQMLEKTLREALAAKLGPVELCVTPSPTEAVWQTLRRSNSVQWSDQGDGDLGERMARASQRVLQAGESVLLIGSDCPQLGAAQLQQAANALQRADAALVPAFDGGYVLLGLNRFDASLFDGIAWSTNTVAAQTRQRLTKLGWTVQNLPVLHDIDEPADLTWLPQAWLASVRTATIATTNPQHLHLSGPPPCMPSFKTITATNCNTLAT